MKELALLVHENVSTYQEFSASIDKGVCPTQSLIVSLDDVPTHVYVNVYFDMIKAFNELGYPVVVSVITHSNYTQSDKVWAELRDLSREGLIEVASHTDAHENLAVFSGKNLYDELKKSYDLICKNVGTCPVSLVLPYGSGWGSTTVRTVAKQVGYKLIVSIGAPYNTDGDGSFRGYFDVSANQPIVARMSPSFVSQAKTFELLDLTFGKGSTKRSGEATKQY
jgi:peptidoglycan/xylan/chitin deacetylase (PgdA/CDA1 family)